MLRAGAKRGHSASVWVSQNDQETQRVESFGRRVAVPKIEINK